MEHLGGLGGSVGVSWGKFHFSQTLAECFGISPLPPESHVINSMRVREAFLTSLFNSKGRGDVQGAFSNREGRDKETFITWGQSVMV